MYLKFAMNASDGRKLHGRVGAEIYIGATLVFLAEVNATYTQPVMLATGWFESGF